MQPLSGNQRPDLLTALMNMFLVLRLPRKMHLCRSSSKVPRLPSFSDMLQNPHVLLTFDKIYNPLHLPRGTTSERPKVAHTCCFFFFLHFDFDMCFAPQRRALFRHLNFQKWSDTDVLCTFWLGNVLRATRECTFSTSQLPKAVRHFRVLYILTWKCASRHNGVHFFDIATSKSGPTLRCFVHFGFEICFAPQRRAIFHLSSGQLAPTRRFSKPTFRPSGASNHWKNTVFGGFPTFSRICIFFLLTLSLLLFSLLIFSLLSASALLCFSSVHIVGSLTSKLPSIFTDYYYYYYCYCYVVLYYIIIVVMIYRTTITVILLWT